MKKNNFITLFLWLVGLFSGCSDIIAPDISSETVIAYTPANGIAVPVSTITFWWEPLSNNTSYQLQVVSPSFQAPAYLVLDTIITGNKLSIRLDSGNYAWRIRADNGAYQTAFSVANQFSVGQEIAGGENQAAIQLLAPAQDFATRDSLVRFSWKARDADARYRLNIHSASYRLDTIVTSQQLDVLFPRADNTLSWQVALVCDTCQATVASQKRMLILDFTPPQAPVLKEPIKNAIVAKENILFSWNKTEDAITTNILYLYTNDSTLLARIPVTGIPVAGTPAAGVPVVGSEYGYTGSLTSRGFYLWQLSSVDRAGNVSTASALRRFQAI